MTRKAFAILGLALAASFASADVLNATLTINSNLASWDSYGSANNVVLTYDINAAFGGGYQNFTLTKIGWDVTLETVGGSWYRELAVGFENSTVSDAVYLRPGVADAFGGGPKAYSSGGLQDLVAGGLDVTLNADNLMSFNFYETFDDVPNSIDGYWDAGSVLSMEFTATAVPEPASMLALGLGVAAMVRRRRSSK